MFLSVITALIVLAVLINFFKRRCNVNRKNHPANSIRHAYSKNEYVRANTIGIVMVSPSWLKFPALRLFVVAMPIQKAVASGKGNNEYYRRRTRSNLK
jgi:hypothetical protein